MRGRRPPRGAQKTMLRTHARRIWPSAALAFCLANAGCSAPTHEEQDPTPEVEEALELTVDDLDIRHGSLRIEATMLDGSADISMWLGPSCEAREVGRGIATRSGFAWSLSGDDVARAIECNLVVKAHGISDDGTRVVKVAALDVGVSLVPDGVDVVRLERQESDGTDTKFTFAAPTRVGRLHIGGTVIGAEDDDADEVDGRGLFSSAFAVGNDDLARSMLHRRHISVLGEHFLATVSVGSVTLDVAEPVELESPVEVAPIDIRSSDDEYEYEYDG
jgi:hypothetical protein